MKEMDGTMQDVLSGIKAGIDIEGMQEALDLGDTTMFEVLVRLVDLGKIKMTVV